MRLSTPGLLVLLVAAALMLTVAVIAVLADPPPPGDTSMAPNGPASDAGRERALARCRTLTMPDAGCEALWEANRRHFLGGDGDKRDSEIEDAAAAQTDDPIRKETDPMPEGVEP